MEFNGEFGKGTQHALIVEVRATTHAPLLSMTGSRLLYALMTETSSSLIRLVFHHRENHQWTRIKPEEYQNLIFCNIIMK